VGKIRDQALSSVYIIWPVRPTKLGIIAITANILSATGEFRHLIFGLDLRTSPIGAIVGYFARIWLSQSPKHA
jgi:hypothetical protein